VNRAIFSAILAACALSAGCAAPKASAAARDDDWDARLRARDEPYGDWNERVALHLGGRRIDSDLLPDSGNDTLFGLEISGAPVGAPIELVLGLFGSGSFGGTFQSEEGEGFGSGEVLSSGASEISFGLRFAPRFGAIPIVPHAGAGVAGMAVHRKESVNGETVRRRDSSGAVYWQVGLTWFGRGGWTVGCDYRQVSGTEFDLGGENGDADYRQFALTIGVHL